MAVTTLVHYTQPASMTATKKLNIVLIAPDEIEGAVIVSILLTAQPGVEQLLERMFLIRHDI